MNKFGRIILSLALVGSLMVTPVYADPSVQDIENSKNQAESEVTDLQTQLTDLLTKISNLEQDLQNKGQEVEKAQTDLSAAQEKEEKQYEDMKLRIKYMYEDGDVSMAEKLLSSESIADVLNQAEYATNLHSYDRKKLEEYVETKQKVADLKSSLEEEMTNMQSMQKEYEDQEDSFNALIADKQSEIANFDQQLQAAIAAAQAARAAQVANANQKSSDTVVVAAADSNEMTNTVSGNTGTTPATNSGYTSSGSGSGSSIVSAAYGYIGVPYVWGGASSSGVDCSGLVMLAHAAIGVSLPHSSGSIGAGGQAVSSPEPGDVVCMSGHVGIYIGGGQMVHAPTFGQTVCVASVPAGVWYRRYW